MFKFGRGNKLIAARGAFMALLYSMLLFATAACTGCNSGDTVAVPRQRAYPRIELPDSSFSSQSVSGISLEVNKAANVTIDNNFVTACYPTLNATLYITVSTVDSSTHEEVLHNRMERFMLNLGDTEGTLLELSTPNGFEGSIISTRPAITTPLQFIVTNNRDKVVSGSAFMPEASAITSDSLAPVATMLQRDILHLVKTISQNQ